MNVDIWRQKSPEKVNIVQRPLVRMSDGSANSKEVSLTGEDKVKDRTLGDAVRGTVLHSASEAIVKGLPLSEHSEVLEWRSAGILLNF